MVLGLLVTGVIGLAGGYNPMDGSCDDPLEREDDDDGVLTTRTKTGLRPALSHYTRNSHK